MNFERQGASVKKAREPCFLPVKDAFLAQTKLVAIIDDDKLVQTSMLSLVRSLGLQAKGFSSAEEFLKVRADHKFDCVISDVQMPGVTGLQLQRLLAEEGEAPPMIMMTAFPSDQVRDQAFGAGAVCFIEKPVNGDKLEECLEEVLGKLA